MKRAWGLVLLLGLSGLGHSLQERVSHNYGVVKAQLNAAHTTVIYVEQDRINQAIPLSGTPQLKINQQTGALYVNDAAGNLRQLQLAIATEAGFQFVLDLAKSDTSVAPILLMKTKRQTVRPQHCACLPVKSAHAISLMDAMQRGVSLPGFRRAACLQAVEIRKHAYTILPRTMYTGAGRRGTVYQIKNRKQAYLTLKKEWFHGPHVIDSKLAQVQLAPDERTTLYQIESMK